MAFLSNLTMNSKVTKRGEMNEVALFAQETLIIIDFIIGEYIIYVYASICYIFHSNQK